MVIDFPGILFRDTPAALMVPPIRLVSKESTGISPMVSPGMGKKAFQIKAVKAWQAISLGGLSLDSHEQKVFCVNVSSAKKRLLVKWRWYPECATPTWPKVRYPQRIVTNNTNFTTTTTTKINAFLVENSYKPLFATGILGWWIQGTCLKFPSNKSRVSHVEIFCAGSFSIVALFLKLITHFVLALLQGRRNTRTFPQTPRCQSH